MDFFSFLSRAELVGAGLITFRIFEEDAHFIRSLRDPGDLADVMVLHALQHLHAAGNVGAVRLVLEAVLGDDLRCNLRGC